MNSIFAAGNSCGFRVSYETEFSAADLAERIDAPLSFESAVIFCVQNGGRFD